MKQIKTLILLLGCLITQTTIYSMQQQQQQFQEQEETVVKPKRKISRPVKPTPIRPIIEDSKPIPQKVEKVGILKKISERIKKSVKKQIKTKKKKKVLCPICHLESCPYTYEVDEDAPDKNPFM